MQYTIFGDLVEKVVFYTVLKLYPFHAGNRFCLSQM